VARYVGALEAEINNVARLVPGRPRVEHVHWGGGSPSILVPDDIRRLAAALRKAYAVADGAEFAIEIDPRNLAPDKVRAFAEAGINRVSLGVQDFDPRVQVAIGREQSFELTRDAISLFRDAGVTSVNIDLVYGLPHQTVESVSRTIAQVLKLAPDRIAAFGYAHLPARVRPQRLIDTSALPGAQERFAQSNSIVELLAAAGYRRVGLDHFARGEDGLAQRPLRRNFQGYTSDAAETLLGLGASAIGKLPGGYVQNAVSAPDYERRIATDGLATARGIELTEEDRVRAYVIERLMCDFRLSARDLMATFGEAARPVLDLATRIAGNDDDGLVSISDAGLEITDLGRPFVRSICARFDGYLDGSATHSTAV
jgi:oxygen-independent coproporphyrinogen-3 oxidase